MIDKIIEQSLKKSQLRFFRRQFRGAFFFVLSSKLQRGLACLSAIYSWHMRSLAVEAICFMLRTRCDWPPTPKDTWPRAMPNQTRNDKWAQMNR